MFFLNKHFFFLDIIICYVMMTGRTNFFFVFLGIDPSKMIKSEKTFFYITHLNTYPENLNETLGCGRVS